MKRILLRLILPLILVLFPNLTFAQWMILSDTTWSGTILVDREVTIKPGKVLTVAAGSVLKMSKGASIHASGGGGVRLMGTNVSPVQVLPVIAGEQWGKIEVRDTGSAVEYHFAELYGGQTKIWNGATADLQDSYFHDYHQGDAPIVFSLDAQFVYMGRCHVSNYYEINLVRSLSTVEDCLFEFTTADAIDFDNSPAGTVIRRTTIRYGRGTNIDAIDFGKVDFQPPGSIGKVEQCLIHDISDKGVSVGEGAQFVEITGTLIYRTGAGVAVKDNSRALIHQNTFYGCEYAIECVEKNAGLGGGKAEAYDNIIWSPLEGPYYLNSTGSLEMRYSDIEGMTDNSRHIFSRDPSFLDAASDDYRLRFGSSCQTAGSHGQPLGAVFPLGGLREDPFTLRLGLPNSVTSLNGDSLLMTYWAAGDSIRSVDLKFSPDGGLTWQVLAQDIPAQEEKWLWQVPNTYSTRCVFQVLDHDVPTRMAKNELPFTILPVGDTTIKADFSAEAGFYLQPVTLSLSAPAGSLIYYTLDGSEPTDRSFLYSGPLSLAGDSIPPGLQEQNVTSTTEAQAPYCYVRTAPTSQIGPNPVFWAKPGGSVMRQQVVRARVYTPGGGLGPVKTRSYFIDSAATRGTFPLPVISIATNPSGLFDFYNGIYIPGAAFTGYSFTGNYEMTGRISERPIHIEYFEAGGGERAFSQDAGLRVRGQWIRSLGQKPLTVYGRTEYDTENEFEYAFFPGLRVPGTSIPIDEFKRFILRQNGNEWGGPENVMCRDALAQSLFNKLNLKYQAYELTELFLNGEYWGIHDLRELNDIKHLSRIYNIPEDSLVMMEDNLDGPFQLIEGHDGDVALFQSLMSTVHGQDIRTDSIYAKLETMIDVDNFTDYWISTLFMNKTTADHNQFYWRVRSGEGENSPNMGHDGRWRWIAEDFDNAFFNANFDIVTYLPTHVHDGFIRRFWENDKYKIRFGNRFCDVLNSNFRESHILEEMDKAENLLSPVIQRHIDRWNTPRDVASWQSGFDKMRDFVNQRRDYLMDDLATRLGFTDRHVLTVDVSSPQHGQLEVNSLQINDQLPGVSNSVYPWTGIYYQELPLTITAHALPGYKFVRWQETDEVTPTIVIHADVDVTRTAIFERDYAQLLTDFSLIPNPVVRGQNAYMSKAEPVDVFSMEGKLVLKHDGSSSFISTSNLEAGSYLIKNQYGEIARLVVFE